MTIASTGLPRSRGVHHVVAEGIIGDDKPLILLKRMEDGRETSIRELYTPRGSKGFLPLNAELAAIEQQEFAEVARCSFCNSRRHSSLSCPEVFSSGC